VDVLNTGEVPPNLGNFQIVSPRMTPVPLPPCEPPESPKLRRSTVYKILGIIILILLAYWMCKVWSHLLPAQPVQYPADYTFPQIY
jgi:hypothetical protein